MNLELLTKQVCNLTRATGSYLKDEIGKLKSTDIQLKAKHNYVTYADKEAENRLIDELAKVLPEAGFIAEENPDITKAEEYNWVIDPLDGTTNYIHGIPLYSISVALMRRNEVVSGVVFEVNAQECFYAWQDSAAYMNRNVIKVSGTENLSESLFATGFPYFDYSRIDDYMELFKDLMQSTRGVRRLGSASVDMAYVACGRFDGFWEYSLSPWDVAAGSLIVKQAGGVNSDFSGNDNYIFGKEIISANLKIYNNFLEVVRKYFG